MQDLPLQRAFYWEKKRANSVYLSQPMGEGKIREWTWAQAMNEARRMAAWLKAQDWEQGARVAIMSKNTAWWIMADLAIWMAGYVSVPIYPNLQSDSVRQILEHSDSKLVFVGKLDDPQSMIEGIPRSVAQVGTPLCAIKTQESWESIVATTQPLQGKHTPASDALATVIYTSGTTGFPKGAMHDFAAFAHTSKALHQLLRGTQADRFFSYLPLAHVAERCLVEGFSLYTGAPVFFAESLDTFVQDLQRARPTLFFSVPRLWMKFQQGVMAKMPSRKLNLLLSLPVLGRVVRKKVLHGLGLDSVRFAGTGAAALPPSVVAWYRHLGLELLEGYGMTEQFAFATISVPGRMRVGFVGESIACCDVKLSDQGEVLTRGPAHMKGYFLNPEQTRDAYTQDGWLKTGDCGELDDQGRLRIVGRMKEQFKTSKGKYVAPAPIESKLAALAGIEACLVTGGAESHQPFAIVMLPEGRWSAMRNPGARSEFTSQVSAHVERINAELDQHEHLSFVAIVPEQWTVEAGLVTPTLKLKRNALEAHYRKHYDQWFKRGSPVVWHDHA
ncbi:AMP-binding acetyl-CoA synthetase [Noviherbaspirillum saxi]|uniref:AMP-binding acetyl-CoA synthetase n=2 Tax=Noviherbaspirillum saxi TaxID=2320863 RepID=A0A3A3GD54_9BURK|nr:AMP-binding acetyl-CoA synthetase [Noviherbaspirillum saxi]